MVNNLQIAIDGPSAAGKSFLAREIALRLSETIDCVYVDTGALYRTIGWYIAKSGLNPSDAEAVAPTLSEIAIDMKYSDGEQVVTLNGEDVSDKIRTPEMSMYASAVSQLPQVRSFLLDLQRGIADQRSVVMDGRDIGTVILPHADVKIFLTATPDERAKRRYADLIAKGISTTLEEVRADIIARDKNDETRSASPLKPAPDAVPFDNSELDREQSIEGAMRIIEEKCGGKIKELAKAARAVKFGSDSAGV